MFALKLVLIVVYVGLHITQAAIPFDVLSCKRFVKHSGYYLQDASHGRWPASGFCRAISRSALPAGSNYAYEVSASLYNVRGWQGVHSGHPGLAYNAQDANNFDFVYFRPHSSSGCFQTGYVSNGIPRFPAGTISSSCPKGPPKGGKWFDVRIKVQGSVAKIYLNNVLVRKVKSHFRPHAKGGIIVANGYQNLIHFKNFKIKGFSSSYPFSSSSCLATARMSGFFLLDAAHGAWPASGFCRTLLPAAVSGPHYSISAKLFNHEGWRGVNSGHPGLMFNARDINNFDFVYFRPHSSGGCFQTGYVRNGVFSGTTSARCPNGPPKGASWFEVRIEVQNNRSKIYLNNVLVNAQPITTYFSPRARGGVIVANGYQNVVYFKNFKLKRLLSLAFPFPSRSCRAVVKMPGYYELDAVHGKWPVNGFCRTMIPGIISGSQYTVSAQLYNQAGWTGINSGHLGLMYNAKDINNFDFVYFRPHSVSGCYQTGYVKNAVPTFKGSTAVSTSCINGPPVGRTWFKAEVRVRSGFADIYRDGLKLGTVPTHHSTRTRGGVIVANGYQNVVYFKNYQLKRLSSLAFPFPSRSCRAVVKMPGYYELDAVHGKWPVNGFCRTMIPGIISGSQYTVSAQLYNQAGWTGINSGHLGLMYNAKDINNFDFVYFRPHSVSGCYQTGYVKNTVPTFKGSTAVSTSCINGPPVGRTWFKAEVRVRSGFADIYRDGLKLGTVPTHHSTRTRGGVIVANGYQNVVYFKNYQLKRLSSLAFPFPSRSCRAVVKMPGYYELDAVHGKWPVNGFCRTMIPGIISGSQYTVSAQLYNQAGWTGINSGHLGLMYNAKDINNFDFVYFRPHSVSGCYQTGYVKNAVPTFKGSTAVSRSCINGPPIGRTWFKAEVRVKGGLADIYRDGLKLGTVPTHHSTRARGGVIVANGYRNVVHFKNYQLRSLIPTLPFTSKSCQRVSRLGSLYQLQGTSARWPASGFCRAFYTRTVIGSHYTISAQLYNDKGFAGLRSGIGHLGLLYNARNIDNFDFVYFRPHWVAGCFQTGYVQNGVVHTSISSSCGNGVPATKTWFEAKVVVTGKTAKIYRDGHLVRTVTTHFSALGRGGVVVANGYRNVVHFKNYQLRSPPPTLPFTSKSCQSVSRLGSLYQLQGTSATWPASGFCRAFYRRTVIGSHYTISAQLYNDKGFAGRRSGIGHLGLLYNARNIDNFDFVYFRPHWVAGCFQTGYVQNGVVHTSISSSCGNGVPATKTWFEAKVVVTGKTAKIYRDGHLVRTVTTHFSALGRGGVVVANGYRNVVHFKNYQLRSPPPTLPFTSKSCQSVSQLGSLYQLQGTSATWPASGFCRAFYRRTVTGSHYTISAQLYNDKGFAGLRSGIGHLGLLYNARNIDNFDFVYFRPHWVAGCFQTGYVQNGVVHTSISSRCGNGVPATKTWFEAKVVVRGKTAKIYRDGHLVRTVTSHFSALGRGGVVVANGYRNVVHFRNYRIVKQ